MGSQLPSQKGHSPPIFGPYLLRPNGCMDQDATWHGARPLPSRLCVRWGPRSPPLKGGGPASPQFSAHVYCGQTARWIKMVLGMEAHLHAKCHLDPSSRLATIDVGRKLGGGSVPFFGEAARSPSNTKSPGPRPTSIPSGILVHLVISPQQIWAKN